MKSFLLAGFLGLITTSSFAADVGNVKMYPKYYTTATISFPVSEILSVNNLSLDGEDGELLLTVPHKVNGLKVINASVPKVKDIKTKDCDIEVGESTRYDSEEISLKIYVNTRNGVDRKKCFEDGIKKSSFLGKLNLDFDLELADTNAPIQNESQPRKISSSVSSSRQ